MCPVPKSNWAPSCSLDIIKRRSAFYQTVRRFFEERGVLEVETPLMGFTNSPDRNIEPFLVPFQTPFCLQTSPEFYMKRLLAKTHTSIFQICKAFRQGEYGRKHNPEFTMLEWYRVDWDHEALIEEVEALLQILLQTGKAVHMEYRTMFQEYLGIDPWETDAKTLKALALKQDGVILELDLDGWLDYFLSHHIEPKLEKDKLIVMKHFPPSQAALSKINRSSYPYAERFEFFYQGMELANGYHELIDQKEQAARFEAELAWRAKENRPMLPVDEKLLSALPSLPACSGVAMGLDRVFMIKEGLSSLQEVLAFPYETL